VNLKRRELAHFELLTLGVHYNNHLQRAWQKYGKENFIFWIVEKVQDKRRLIGREQFYLDLFQSYSFGIYNICLVAGSPLGFKHSEEAKRKISKSNRGKHCRLGYKHSEETKLQISKSLEGHKGSKGMLDKKHSEESKEAIRKAGRGNQNRFGDGTSKRNLKRKDNKL
jgi:group I intron endonuclease